MVIMTVILLIVVLISFNLCHITSLPGSFAGCQVSSFDDLLTENIEGYFKDNFISQEQDKLKIKINGDNARMTRNSNYIILSFSLLQTGQDVMSSKGNEQSQLLMEMKII